MHGDNKANEQQCTGRSTEDATRRPKAIRALTPSEQMPADKQHAREPVTVLACELLAAVDRGSAPELLQQLSRILATDRQRYPADGDELEGLMLLQEVADHLRTDLELMLMQIYQRLESSRACLGLVRHLAEAGGPEATRVSGAAYPCQGDNLIPWPESSATAVRLRQMFATRPKAAKDMPPDSRNG